MFTTSVTVCPLFNLLFCRWILFLCSIFGKWPLFLYRLHIGVQKLKLIVSKTQAFFDITWTVVIAIHSTFVHLATDILEPQILRRDFFGGLIADRWSLLNSSDSVDFNVCPPGVAEVRYTRNDIHVARGSHTQILPSISQIAPFFALAAQ